MSDWEKAFAAQEAGVRDLRDGIYGTNELDETKTLVTEHWKQVYGPFPPSSATTTSCPFGGECPRNNRAERVARNLEDLKAAHDKLHERVKALSQGRVLPEDKSIIAHLLKLFFDYLMSLPSRQKQ